MPSETVLTAYQAYFTGTPLLVRSPGRINLIGEHTDYNEGFVLPAAIDKEITFALALNGTPRAARIFATDIEASFEFDLRDFSPSTRGWPNYLMGVVRVLQNAGYEIPGFDCVFGGNIPIGAGLSSSAALECGIGFGLNELLDLGLDTATLARYGQSAEHQFVGVNCGIMDQFANMHGKAGHVIRLDCRSLAFSHFPLDLSDYRIVLFNTRVSHSLASSAYNTRRQQCEAGVAHLQRHMPAIRSLRDVAPGLLEGCRSEMDPIVFQRCSYVIAENQRVNNACADLAAGNLHAFGQRMYASHAGLQHEYEVSCDELDFLVDQTRDLSEVLGARMMGGGFGGCTINLVHIDAIESVSRAISSAYTHRFGQPPEIYIANIAAGTSRAE
jgi:galactokinase